MTTVLIVDDSAWIAKVMKTVLGGGGFDVIGIAKDGLEGVDLYAKHRPDVVLLDITMPNMDGRECLENIMEFDPQAKIIMVSAIKEQQVVEACLDHGAVDFIEKPIDIKNKEKVEALFLKIENAATKS